MQTKVSIRGQVVLPAPLRRRLGIQAGDPLDARIEAGGIILTPRQRRPGKATLTVDTTTGLPVLSAGPDAPALSSQDVAEILSRFP